jgi:transposase InsO family protein
MNGRWVILEEKEDLMNQIKCPNCGEVFTIDESSYDSIVKQIRDHQFNEELRRREKDYQEKLQMQLDALKQKTLSENLKALNEKDLQIEKLKNELSGKEKENELLTKEAVDELQARLQEKENLIKQDFSADKPYTKLLTDISQIQCIDGKLYISPILDCFNGEILSLIMRDNMKKELCIDTLKAARMRYPISGATLHSDRGSQYTSDGFKAILKANNMLQSLSGVDHCYDNARMESFFATLKKELLYRLPTYRMKMSEVKSWIFRYVFTYYNTVRIYTSNPNGLPPAAYRRTLLDEALAA